MTKDIDSELKRQISVMELAAKIPTHVVLSEQAALALCLANDAEELECSTYSLKILTHQNLLMNQDVLVLSCVGSPFDDDREMKDDRLRKLEIMTEVLCDSSDLDIFRKEWSKLNNPRPYGMFTIETAEPRSFEEVKSRMSIENNRVQQFLKRRGVIV